MRIKSNKKIDFLGDVAEFLKKQNNLNLERKKDRKINYVIINQVKINNNLVAHIHCYDLNNFNNYFKDYIKLIKKNFDVIVTFIENENNECLPDYDFTYLKIENIGMDIGSKFSCIDYLNKNNIKYKFILMIHSKTNDIVRNKYLNKLFLNFDETLYQLNKKNNNYGVFVPNIIHNYSIDYNKYHIDYLTDKMNLKFNYKQQFPEGNFYILNYEISNYLYNNRFDIYSKLNNNNSLDYIWFTKYYNLKLSLDDVNRLIKENKIFCNNLFISKLNIMVKEKQLRDCMIEHSFERILFCVSEYFNKKNYIIGETNFDYIYNRWDSLTNKLLEKEKIYNRWDSLTNKLLEKEKIYNILAAGRSNNFLDTTNLESMYPNVKNIKDSVRDILNEIKLIK